MNRQPDVEFVLRDYFAEDGLTAPDHVLDVVEQRIAGQRRPAWRLRGRPYVNTYTRLAAGIAAVLFIGLVGWQLLPGGSGTGGPPTPAPTATPAPSPSPSPSPGVLKSGVSGPGTFTGRFATSPIPWTVTIPKGWSAYDSDIVMGPQRPGDVGTAIITERAINVPKDSCAPAGTVPAATAEEFLSAVEARKDWDVSDRQAATIGAFPATRIDIVLPDDPALCGVGKDYFVLAHDDGTGFYLQGPSMHVSYWVADVNGEPLVVERFSFAATPASDLAESDAVVDSIEITP